MSFWSKLFGQKADSVAAAPAIDSVDYKGFEITPQPLDEGGQFRIAAMIRKGEGEHYFIRSDVVPTLETCVDLTLLKTRRLIDEQGEQIF